MARKIQGTALDFGIDEKWYSDGFRREGIDERDDLIMKVARITRPEFGAFGDGLSPVHENLKLRFTLLYEDGSRRNFRLTKLDDCYEILSRTGARLVSHLEGKTVESYLTRKGSNLVTISVRS